MLRKTTLTCRICKQILPRSAFSLTHEHIPAPPAGVRCDECIERRASRYRVYPNPADPSGQTICIKLTHDKFAIIDSHDALRVLGRRWSATEGRHTWYAHSHKTSLHRFIIDATPGVEVDHIDGNGLNCSKSNLREVTPTQNRLNCKLNARNRSGYKGVRFRSDIKRWEAYINLDGYRYLGCFDDPKEAALAHDAATRTTVGSDGRYNFPRDGEIGIRSSTSSQHLQVLDPVTPERTVIGNDDVSVRIEDDEGRSVA